MVLRTMKFTLAMMFFLVLYVTTLAPAIELVSTNIQGLQPDNATITVIPQLETALFLGMPLILLGGVLVTLFVVASGLRGTSR
jgi:hypothetical protein